MNPNKLGPWIPSSVNPVHVGYYQTRRNQNQREYPMKFWDGYVWRIGKEMPKSNFGYWVVRNGKEHWRGLAEKPE